MKAEMIRLGARITSDRIEELLDSLRICNDTLPCEIAARDLRGLIETLKILERALANEMFTYGRDLNLITAKEVGKLKTEKMAIIYLTLPRVRQMIAKGVKCD